MEALARLAGPDAEGRPVEIDLATGRSVLVFLTSSCRPCRDLWASTGVGASAEMVFITPDPATESRRAVAALAPPGARVVMSSEAWFAFGVRRAPYWVVLEDGVVVYQGREEP